MAEERLRALFSHITADGLPPHVTAPSDDSLGGALRSSGGANVKVEDGLSAGLGLAGVVVDDISDLFLLAVDVTGDVPVVSIKGRLGSIN